MLYQYQELVLGLFGLLAAGSQEAGAGAFLAFESLTAGSATDLDSSAGACAV
jgi:hypothetical protein